MGLVLGVDEVRVHSPTSRSGSRIYLSIWDLFWALEPIQEVVESDESVVILCWRLIRGGAPDVEA